MSSILEEYLEFVTYGFTNPMPDAEFGPWKITAKDVIDGEINFETARKTTLSAFKNDLTDKSRPKVGDVLLTKDGTLGRLALVDREDICVNQSVAVLRPNKKILPEYLFYLLSSPKYQTQMIGDSDGSVIKHIYITRVGKMIVEIPSINIQRKIVDQLFVLDNKIKLNRQTNQTLEQIAQAIFQSWFVDFDPVRAKKEKRDTGLPPHIADLFPDEFVGSELGMIPKGWEVRKLGEIADVNWGDTKTTKSAYVPQGYLAYSATGPDGFLEKFDFDQTGVVVSAIGANAGKTWLAYGRWSCIKNTIRMWSTDQRISTEYLYNATRERNIWPLRGSAQPFISQADARAIRINVPKDNLATYYGLLVEKLYLKMKSLDEENGKLSQLRDELLPKLLSGEISLNYEILEGQ
ncbi:restriction endonuclease subunit S [Leptospira terpstrae]|uniref:restriction endonuclease subunit S n=1 Tax=Leptospira terpstrae TaxID=293075 RepID=UPI003CFFC837